MHHPKKQMVLPVAREKGRPLDSGTGYLCYAGTLLRVNLPSLLYSAN